MIHGGHADCTLTILPSSRVRLAQKPTGINTNTQELYRVDLQHTHTHTNRKTLEWHTAVSSHSSLSSGLHVTPLCTSGNGEALHSFTRSSWNHNLVQWKNTHWQLSQEPLLPVIFSLSHWVTAGRARRCPNAQKESKSNNRTAPRLKSCELISTWGIEGWNCSPTQDTDQLEDNWGCYLKNGLT